MAAPRAITNHDRLPVAGTVLTRTYRGRRVEVRLLTSGFAYGGQTYRSLSAVAKAVTGSHWNGLLFFGLTKQKEKRAEATDRERPSNSSVPRLTVQGTSSDENGRPEPRHFSGAREGRN